MHVPKIARVRFALAAAGAAVVVSLVPAASRAAEDAAKKEDTAKKEKMPSYPALMKKKPMDVMHMMDNDKSDSVSREEFMKFYEALYERLDRDKNDQLSPKEFTDAG